MAKKTTKTVTRIEYLTSGDNTKLKAEGERYSKRIYRTIDNMIANTDDEIAVLEEKKEDIFNKLKGNKTTEQITDIISEYLDVVLDIDALHKAKKGINDFKEDLKESVEIEVEEE